MTFVWEPAPRLPGEPVRDGDRPAGVVLTATAPDGSPYFRGRVAPPAGAPATATASRVTFEAPPGKMQLRLSVEGAGAQVLDSEVREVVVPDLTSPETVFGTAEVFRARTIPEIQRLKADADAVPTAAREFSRTERLLIRVHPYGAAGTSVTARLMNRAGQPIADLPVAVSDSSRTTSSTIRQIEVLLANLSPAEYGVEITAAGGGSSVKDIVAFRVTP